METSRNFECRCNNFTAPHVSEYYMKSLIFILLVLTLLGGCCSDSGGSHRAYALQDNRYVPHLGWLMVQVQIYHAKLSFAGAAQNWELAAYYAHELEEALEDAEKFHPEHEGIKIQGLIKAITMPQLENVEHAVEQKDAVAFSAAFEQLTASCNQCHQATGKSVIRVKVPQNVGLPNQDFNP